MPDPCKDIHPACAETFRQIVNKLDDISHAVLGNGRPRDSMVDRLARLEERGMVEKQHGDRYWKIATVAIGALAVLIAALR